MNKIISESIHSHEATNDLGENIHGEDGVVTISKNIKKMIKNALNYQYKNLSEYEEVQIIEALEKLDLEKDWYSKGNEGSVFKITIKDKQGNDREFIVAKKRYDNNPDNERDIHNKTEDIVREWKEEGNKKGEERVSRVPDLKAVLGLETGEKFIIMEFIKGKTLYQHHIEKILEKWGVPHNGFENDIAAQSVFFRVMNLNPLNKEDSEKAEKVYLQERKSIKLFSKEQGDLYINSMRSVLQAMHKKGVYHRDGSNPRNIIIEESETGEQKGLVFFDFGKSVDIIKENIPASQVYSQQEGELEGNYPRDEEILGILAMATKTEEDEELDVELLQRKQLRRNIEKGDSLFGCIEESMLIWIKKPEKRKEVLEKAKRRSLESKIVKLDQVQNEKTNEDKTVLLLAQSQENATALQEEINKRKKNFQVQIKENERYVHNPIWQKKIQGWTKEIEKIEVVEKLLEQVLQIVKK